MTALTELLARCEAAKADDRELDEAIWKTLCWKHHWRDIARAGFTSSLDSALALVERMLPGASWTVFSSSPPGYEAAVDQRLAMGATPALALVSALLRALIAQESGNA